MRYHFKASGKTDVSYRKIAMDREYGAGAVYHGLELLEINVYTTRQEYPKVCANFQIDVR